MTSNDQIKMTNDEIKKALECCSIENINTCEYCPFEKHSNCKEEMLRYTLDLINQYEAEIERLKWERDAYIEIQNTAIAEAKAEAYKECIEKVKEYIDTYEHLACEKCECVPISKDGLDNLLKEMGVE